MSSTVISYSWTKQSQLESNKITLHVIWSRITWMSIRITNFLVQPYVFRTRDYRIYSAIADILTLQFTRIHTLGLSVFTSRILATDLSVSL
jgi:hypothetical protein